MAVQGWYPDPGGEPGKFRYWDGSAWSAQTADNAHHPPPPNSVQFAAATGSRRSKINPAALIGLLAVVLILVVAGFFVVRSLGGGPIAVSEPSSTVSGWDDSAPIDTLSPTPSPTPTPTVTPADQEKVACPEGNPYPTDEDPDDGRVHGGHLSFPIVDSYGDPEPKASLKWLHDTGSQKTTTEPGWNSWFALGEVETGGDFDTPKDAAASSMQCLITGGSFRYFESRTDIRNEKITIDGHDGWILVSEIRVGNPDLSVDGDVVTFVFVDDGRKNRLSAHASVAPIGDQRRLDLAQQVLHGLRVN